MTQPTSAAHQYTSVSGCRSNTFWCVHADLGEIATGRVHDALGPRGGAARVEEVEEVLGVHRLGRALG